MTGANAQRFRGDEGSVIVQTAFSIPVVMLIFLGIFEYGMVFRDYLSASDAVLDGARIGAIMGGKSAVGGASADQVIMDTLRNDLSAMPASSIKKVVIFKGQPFGQGNALAQVPSACRFGNSSSSASSCNLYDATTAFTQIQAANAAYFQCTTAANSPPPCGWPPTPTARRDGSGTTTANPIIDYVGVYVKIDRPFVTRMFGTTFTFEAAGTQRIEPGTVSI